jgi:hypothetical protein
MGNIGGYKIYTEVLKNCLVKFLFIGLLVSTAFAKYSGGIGEPDNPYQIATKANLLQLAADMNDYGGCFILTADIDMEGQVFTIAIIATGTSSEDGFQGVAFTGTFDGNGHKITNFTINGGSNEFIGLFGCVESGVVENLGLEDFAVSGYRNVGGLVGYNNHSNISNCYSTGAVTGGENSVSLGGLVGYSGIGFSSGVSNISNCHSTGAITGGDGSSGLGGLVGSSHYTNINNCYSTCVISSGYNSSYCLGGLVGYSYYSTVSNCYSTGNVTGGDCSSGLGGMIGSNPGGIINCSSTGSVTGGDESYNLGGLVGYNGGYISDCSSTGVVTGGYNSNSLGGLAGDSDDGDIYNSYSIGDITGGDYSYYIGGLVGYSYYNSSIEYCFSTGAAVGGESSQEFGGLVGYNRGNIRNCFSTGDVICGDYSYLLGGLVGWNQDHYGMGGIISNCYSTSAIAGGYESYNLGGLAGGMAGDGAIISSCYFLVTSGLDNGYGMPLTNGQMKQQSSFVGWDFVDETANGTDDIWRINNGVYYPKLAWQQQQQSLAGDFDGSGAVDFYDLFVFIDQWLLEKLSADIKPDGIVNFLDYTGFANNWQGDMNNVADFCSQWLKSSAYCADIAPVPDGDGIVNMLDFAVFAEVWLVGFVPAPPEPEKFYELTLDTNPGWTTEGLWAFGQPTGGGGDNGGPDPTAGYTGVNVYGYNLAGGYENSLSETNLTSTAIDCSGRSNVHLKFWRWLGVEQPTYDHAYIQISNNGTNWVVVWQNNGEVDDLTWKNVDIDISAVADNQATVYLRWTMGSTDSSYTYCGWNIDDIQLWENP